MARRDEADENLEHAFERWNAGDEGAFDELYPFLRKLVAGVLLNNFSGTPFEPDEVLNEVMIGKFLPHVKTNRPNDLQHFRSLAIQHIYWTLNTMSRSWRAKKRKTSPLEQDNAGTITGTVSSAERAEFAAKLRGQLDALPLSDRQLFCLLSCGPKTSQADVARRLSISQPEVSKRVKLISKRLKAALGPQQPKGAFRSLLKHLGPLGLCGCCEGVWETLPPDPHEKQ
jgi:RNA polymerase sigma factor (sigma-70 family)